MRLKVAVTKAMVAVVGCALCGVPELAQAWQQPTQQTESQQQPGITVNPAQGPLAPVPAPETQPIPAQPNQGMPRPAPSTQLSRRPSQPAPSASEPLGTAAAEGLVPSGGGASRPAGTAIAPAKQHQTRALLIKLGAVAAAGIAIGTVAGLSKATPSTPPGSRAAAAH